MIKKGNNSAFYSPLRYPGGKRKLAAFIAQVCVDNGIRQRYVEPYSGGASVGLFLLLENFVERIVINDKDRSLYAFWYALLNDTENFCEKIEKIPVTIEEWNHQRKIQENKETADLLDLGFSTFYLNRTNRSGIITGGVIGGVKQTGKYSMDCRFNKKPLIQRIKSIALRRDSISLYNKDAIDLMGLIQKGKEETFMYLDPPYYNKASTLYMNYYGIEDHVKVSNYVKSLKGIKWLVSYDNAPEIKDLYRECPSKEFSFKHTAYESRHGEEILFFSPDIRLPVAHDFNPLAFKMKQKRIIYDKKTLVKK